MIHKDIYSQINTNGNNSMIVFAPPSQRNPFGTLNTRLFDIENQRKPLYYPKTILLHVGFIDQKNNNI